MAALIEPDARLPLVNRTIRSHSKAENSYGVKADLTGIERLKPDRWSRRKRENTALDGDSVRKRKASNPNQASAPNENRPINRPNAWGNNSHRGLNTRPESWLGSGSEEMISPGTALTWRWMAGSPAVGSNSTQP
jgi:hypothetical protein